MDTPVTRRTLARGAAWSLPVIAVAAVAPVAAASPQCTPALTPQDTLAFSWGNYTQGGQQTLAYSSGVQVTGLPQGVTVTRVTVTRWIQQRESGQAGPGLPWPGENNSSAAGSCSSTGCSISYTPSNTGWLPNFLISGRDQPYTDSQGNSFTGWSITTTFDGTRSGAGSLTAGPQGCNVFVTRPSGPKGWDAPLVATYRNNPKTPGNSRLRALTERVVTVTLSNGQVVTQALPSVISDSSDG